MFLHELGDTHNSRVRETFEKLNYEIFIIVVYIIMWVSNMLNDEIKQNMFKMTLFFLNLNIRSQNSQLNIGYIQLESVLIILN